jgi:hypothetical protein
MIEGSAEVTTLSEQSVDLITVAQAIHWFEPEATKKEFLRILKPDGWLAVLRNFGTNDELSQAIGEILIEENGVDTSYVSKLPAGKPMNFYYGHNDFLQMSFPYILQESWKHFIGAMCSAANTPDEDHPLYPNLERAAKRIFDRFSTNELLEVCGETELFLGKSASHRH